MMSKRIAYLLLILSGYIAFGNKYFDARAEIPQPSSLEALIDSADNCIAAEKWNLASEIYQDALRLYPASPLNSKLFANLGICYTRLSRYDDALECFDISLIRDSLNAHTLTSRASLFLLTGQNDKALSDLESALKIDSVASSALKLHGKLMLKMNNTDKARKDFYLLRKFDPSDPWGPAGLAEIEFISGNSNAAIPLLKEALKLEENSDFRLSLGGAYISTNKLSEAEQMLRESILLYPSVGEFYLLRGKLHKILHQNREVELDKKMAIQYGVDPQIVELYLPSQSK